jgi:hypothetical protein
VQGDNASFNLGAAQNTAPASAPGRLRSAFRKDGRNACPCFTIYRTGPAPGRPRIDRGLISAYHNGMQRLRWSLVFTPSSLEHLAERDIDADDVADVVFGRYGSARIRRGGRGERTRWFIVAPTAGGELMTCVLRAARPRDLDSKDALVIPAAGDDEKRSAFNRSMRVCVSARMSVADEVRSYRAWRRSKGER